jgi:hypothetical protein
MGRFVKYKIGETFTFQDVEYIVEKHDGCQFENCKDSSKICCCDSCDGYENEELCLLVSCHGGDREDGEYIIVKRVRHA